MNSKESWLSKMKDNKTLSLFIDTATKVLAVGALFGDKTLVSKPMDSKKALEQTNLAIEELGKELGFSFRDVDNFYCLLGPGSNTGIRLGLTIPKTVLAFNPAIHLYGIETLKLFLAKDKNNLAALSDRSGNLFVGHYKDGQYTFDKINKSNLDSLDKTRKIYIEEGDTFAEEELSDFTVQRISVINQMIDNRDQFEDFTDNDDNYLPIYSQAI